MASFGGWADDEDGDGAVMNDYLPESHTTGPDEKGVSTRTSYRINDGEKQRVVTKTKLVTKRKKISKRIQERRQWKKFGLAKDAAPGPEEETTIISRDEYKLEIPGEEAKAARREEEDMIARLRAGKVLRQKREEFEAKQSAISGSPGDQPIGGSGGLRTGTALSQMAEASGGAAGAAGSKYVPLHLRPGATGEAMSSNRFDDSDQSTLRVTNISEDTTEDDLRELFSGTGRIQRVYLAKDRETQVSRGFAYISFYARSDAQHAMERLNGFGYDHLILKVEWAKPSTRDDTGGGDGAMRHTSGYGGALPQGLA